MSTTLDYTDTLTVLACCHCEITFAFPASFERRRREDHVWFYCPAGHQQHYSGLNEAEKANKRVTELERQLASRHDDLRWEREQRAATQRQLSATKGQLTKTRKRIEHGVCIHCHRSFPDLALHMGAKHADLLDTDPGAEASTQTAGTP